MHRIRRTAWMLAAVVMLGLATLVGSHPVVLQAQANPGTQPIPANIGWTQETLNGLNAINAFRTQQQPPQAPLQIDATLQYAAAWEVNDQMTKGQCLAGGGPWVQPTPSPLTVCPHTDSLGRGPGPRTAAFGYPNGGEENALFHGGDATPDSLTKGQNAYQGWYDLPDPDANGVPTFAHRKGLINPSDTVIGLAMQCDVFAHSCFWVADFGSCMMMPFTPISGPTPPTGPTPPACQGAGPVTLPAATLQPSPVPTFAGTWVVDKFDSGVGGPLTLTQNGNQVTGTYSFADPSGCGNETGTLTGTTSGTGDLLTYSNSDTGCGAPNRYSGSQIRLSGDGQTFTAGTRWNGKVCGGAAPACPILATTTTQPTTNTTNQPTTNTTQPAPTTTTTTQPTTGPTTVTQPTTTTTVTQPTTGPTGAGWAASWGTDFGSITLTQNGNQVSGTNNYVDSNNVPTTLSVNGTSNGNVLTGTFGITPPTPAFGGTMTFTLAADGNSFAGTYTLPGNNTGTWNGTRTGP